MARRTPTAQVDDDDLSPDFDADNGDTDNLVEVVHEGRTYQVPAAIAPVVAAHADHDQKGQALEQARRAFAAHRLQAKAKDEASVGRKATVQALKAQIASLDHIDWQAFADHSPQEAARMWAQYQQLRTLLARTLAHHGRQEEADALDDAKAHTARLQDGHAILARDLPGWSPQLAARLAQFAQSDFGFSPQELSAVADPRLVKLLHAALASRDSERAARIARGQKTEPAKAVRGAVGALAISPDTYDFSAFEKLADAKLKRRR